MGYLVRIGYLIVTIRRADSIEHAAAQFAQQSYGPTPCVRRLTGRPGRAGYFQVEREEAGRRTAMSPRFYVAFDPTE